MCELDYKVTSDADNNPEINISLVTVANYRAPVSAANVALLSCMHVFYCVSVSTLC